MTFSVVLEILGVVALGLHFAGIVFAVHATLLTRTSQGAIAWALSLIFFPYIAVPLYLVFGRQKFHGYVEARRKGDRSIDHVAAAVAAVIAPWKAVLHGQAERFGVLESLSLLPFTTGNAARLLVDGEATFHAIFSAIDAAKSYLLVQFFIIRDDALGRELQERLIRKAGEGVRIYVLYDEIGSVRLPNHYKAKLLAAGVQIRAFNTQRGWWNRFQINFRNHRKIVVADGAVAYVGGHNVGDEYMGRSRRFGRWRDTHVELRGPSVAAVELSFMQDWNWATDGVLELPPREPMGPAAGGEGAVLIVPSGPADEINTCTLMLLAVISAARERLWITSPYFVPDETVYDALQLAALRGVDVRIMLPAMPDHLLVYLSAFSYLESAEHVGVKFYRYEAGFLHQKVMLVDGDLAAVGTANLDNRSMRLNFELTAFFADHGVAARVASMLERDFAETQRATPGDLKRRGLWFRLAVRIARLLSPIQ